MKRPVVIALAVVLALVCLGAAKCTRESTGGGGSVEVPGPPPADRNTRISNVEKGYWTPRRGG